MIPEFVGFAALFLICCGVAAALSEPAALRDEPPRTGKDDD